MSTATGTPRRPPPPSDEWSTARDRLRSRGLRWTPQRRLLLGVLAQAKGHITASELLDRCREADPQTIPSTVYRTLDVLEDLGLVRHGHGADGREEFHVLPQTQHGHMYCRNCGRSWEVNETDARALLTTMSERHGFDVDLSHLTLVGMCSECRAKQV